MSCSKNQMGEGTSREVASPTDKCRSLIQCPPCGQQQNWHFGLHLSVLVSAFQFPIWKTYSHDVAAITTRGPSCARVLWSHWFPVAPAVTSCSLRPRGPLRGKKSLADSQRATGWLKGVCVCVCVCVCMFVCLWEPGGWWYCGDTKDGQTSLPPQKSGSWERSKKLSPSMSQEGCLEESETP